MSALQRTQIGHSVGVILPKEVLVRLSLEKSDTFFLSDAAHGLMLTPDNPRFDAPMTPARRLMKNRREVWRALAK